MNSYDFEDRVAVVTGGAQGIGLAVARRLAAGGASVVLWDMDGDLAAREAAALGGHMDAVRRVAAVAAAGRLKSVRWHDQAPWPGAPLHGIAKQA